MQNTDSSSSHFDGMIAAVGKAFKSAFEKWLGNSAAPQTSPTPSRLISTSSSSPLSITEVRTTKSQDSTAVAAPHILLRYSIGKQPRADSFDDLQVWNSPAGSITSVSSPILKRRHSWYPVKARQPIARMKEEHQTAPKTQSSAPTDYVDQVKTVHPRVISSPAIRRQQSRYSIKARQPIARMKEGHQTAPKTQSSAPTDYVDQVKTVRPKVISSPAIRRHQSRYSIKARQPIARMKEGHQTAPKTQSSAPTDYVDQVKTVRPKVISSPVIRHYQDRYPMKARQPIARMRGPQFKSQSDSDIITRSVGLKIPIRLEG